MRVLHVVHAWPPEAHGGVQSYVRDLMRAQRAAGDAPCLLTGSFAPHPFPQVVRAGEDDGVPMFRLHRDDAYASWHARAFHPEVAGLFTGVLGEVRPDVVHVHHWMFLSTDLVTTAARAGVPAVVTLHDLYTSCPRCYRVDREQRACERPLGPASCRRCVPSLGHESDAELDRAIDGFALQLQNELRLARAIFVSTAATAALLERTTAMPRGRLAVLPFGYEPRLTAPPGQPPAGPPWRFVYIGELSLAKGTSVLLRAFRRLIERITVPVQLELFGGTDDVAYGHEVDDLARGLPVARRGRYAPAELAAVRAHAAVLPMPSFQTWCFVLDECRELALPCIVADTPVLRERIGAGGLVVPRDDADALARAMQRCIEEPGLLARLRENLPAAPMRMHEHARGLAAEYREAIASSAPSVPADSRPSRAELVALFAEHRASTARAAGPGVPR